ncbi:MULTISPECIES: hypothetical protein [Leeuwenhoekiella]|jgi:transposase-like protein|uniref:hypothetical protein n=1 Tax=Leeuwenhoekiella TaxID=283735 RepID=UPI000C69A1A1|nr:MULTISPECIES: hypothetical protein [Leeuwenhoekiella]MAO43436.1 hypothetical protein [Leeuwenhoekiella sp.]MBQ52211.1 hypothetical protein [Leeuwenhoekiella sp.]HBT09316.1 hypothetical protein [Leeuwenhoekiella sp.]|tara:strand:+ start:8036 stop:8281 length:246 start_codon:yes stop_codon:yes gene_type:complete
MSLQNPTKNPLKRMQCKIFGHTYSVLRHYQTNQKEYECTHCKKQFTEDEYGQLAPLTPKLRRINEVMEKFYIFKSARRQSA